jgi:hypothetical protein
MKMANKSPVHPAEAALKDGGHFAVEALHNEERRLLRRHLEDHRLWLTRDRGEPVDWNEAAASWYENVWLPLSGAVERKDFLRRFPEKRTWDLYREVSEHWHYLKEVMPEISAGEAACRYAAYRGRGWGECVEVMTPGGLI